MERTKKLIGAELAYFDQYFEATFRSDVPLLDKVLQYIARQKGKQMRAMLVLLSARLGGDINDKSYRAALFVEMLHTSSLVHDDLVDDSLERRGAFSVNALWKNKIAVLTGDNLFTKSILLLLENGDHQTLKIFSDAIGMVIEGELLQMDKSRKLNLDEAVYFEIIKNKTATLLAAACGAGAASTFSDEKAIEKIQLFGQKLGIAFQVKDDLFDYGNEDVGKPTGNDIKERKVTLPLIYTLNNCDVTTRRKIIYILKNNNTDKKKVSWVIAEVRKAGGLTYAAAKMQDYAAEARAILQDFSLSEARAALEELLDYTIERSY